MNPPDNQRNSHATCWKGDSSESFHSNRPVTLFLT